MNSYQAVLYDKRRAQTGHIFDQSQNRANLST